MSKWTLTFVDAIIKRDIVYVTCWYSLKQNVAYVNIG